MDLGRMRQYPIPERFESFQDVEKYANDLVASLQEEAVKRLEDFRPTTPITTSISTTVPLTGGGDFTSNRTFALSYNATNLKLTANALNTIQDIAPASSPAWANVSLGTGELTAGSINRASGTMLLEIGGSPVGGLAAGIAAFGYSDTGKISLRDAATNERAFLQLATTTLTIDADSDIYFAPANATVLRLLAAGNLTLGATAVGTSGVKVLGVGGSTTPTTSPADMWQAWSEDRDGTAGKAAFHYREEGGIARPFDRLYDVRDYGASSSESAANNRTYIQAAIDAATSGGTVIIPRMSSAYSLDNGTPLVLDGTKATTLMIEGEVNFTDATKDLCDVTGDGILIVGTGGKVKGPGTFDQSGSLDSIILHVTGDRCTVRDLLLEDPVQCGIFFDGAPGGIVDGVRIVGGTAFGMDAGTQNYGIEIEGATTTGVLLSSVSIVPNPTPSVTLTGSTISFADADPDEIRDSNNGLAVFTAGQHIKVSGSTSNDGTQYVIASASAGTLVLRAADTLTAEGAGDTVTVSTVDVMVQGVSGGSAAGLGHITVTGCYFEGLHDHATYLFGDYYTLTGNTVNSTMGSSLRVVGKYGTISSNTIKNCLSGGIDAANSDGVVITGNTVQGFGYNGIDIYEYSAYSGNFDNIIISNNTLTAHDASSGTVYAGIRFNSSDRSADNLQICINTIRNADNSGDGYNAIWVHSDGTDTIDRVKIDGNIIDTVGDGGIVCKYITDGSISHNTIRDPAQQTANKRGIELTQNCDNIEIAHNRIIKETGGNAMDYGIAIVASANNTNCHLFDNDVNGAGTSFFLATYSEGHRWDQIDASFNKSFSGDFALTGSDTVKFALHNAAGVERAFLQIADTILYIDADSDIEMRPANSTAGIFKADGSLELGEIKLLNDHIWDNSDNEGGAITVNNVGKDGGATQFKNFAIHDGKGGTIAKFIGSTASVGLGLVPTANMLGLSIEAGLITIKEITTPTADATYGKIYTKDDNKLYFQDGAGNEHEVAYAP